MTAAAAAAPAVWVATQREAEAVIWEKAAGRPGSLEAVAGLGLEAVAAMVVTEAVRAGVVAVRAGDTLHTRRTGVSGRDCMGYRFASTSLRRSASRVEMGEAVDCAGEGKKSTPRTNPSWVRCTHRLPSPRTRTRKRSQRHRMRWQAARPPTAATARRRPSLNKFSALLTTRARGMQAPSPKACNLLIFNQGISSHEIHANLSWVSVSSQGESSQSKGPPEVVISRIATKSALTRSGDIYPFARAAG